MFFFPRALTKLIHSINWKWVIGHRPGVSGRPEKGDQQKPTSNREGVTNSPKIQTPIIM